MSYHFDFFSPKKVKKSRYDDTEFFTMDGDEDGDGVPDLQDRCPNTPSGSGAVDEFGCSLDTDGDGVFDYADQEPNTDPSLNVDANGVGITDGMTSLTEDDTLATLHAKMYEVYPDMKATYGKTAKDKESSDVLRSEIMNQSPYGIVDTDSNGVISVGEVYEAIDKFFEGELDVNAQYINGLIDYFFDQ